MDLNRFFYKQFRISIIGALCLALVGCVNNKDFTYLQDLKEQEEFKTPKAQYKLQKGDQLNINISSTDPASDLIFNRSSSGIGGQVNDQSLFMSSYIINSKGEITLPYVSSIKAEGKSIQGLTDDLEVALKDFLKDYVIDIKLSNYRITVLGEVKRSGTYNVSNTSLNILQGIGLGGGLNDFGNRSGVQVLRDINGVTKIFEVDLTSTDFLASNGYSLQNNDVIYVPPMKNRSVRANTNVVQLSISGLTLLTLVLNLVFKNGLL